MSFLLCVDVLLQCRAVADRSIRTDELGVSWHSPEQLVQSRRPPLQRDIAFERKGVTVLCSGDAIEVRGPDRLTGVEADLRHISDRPSPSPPRSPPAD